MNTTIFKRALLASAVGSALVAVSPVYAESNTTVGIGNISATAAQDFRVIIPRFITFRVGVAGAGSYSLIDCDMSAVAPATLGNAVAQACTGGDVGGGVSTVSVRSNAGPININVTTLGALTNGTDTMPYTEILTLSSDPANLPAPTLVNGAGTAVNVAISSGANVTNRSATYTYTFANSTLYASGTYGGVNVQNGRVTYTAANF